jgi:hypothetical protein
MIKKDCVVTFGSAQHESMSQHLSWPVYGLSVAQEINADKFTFFKRSHGHTTVDVP